MTKPMMSFEPYSVWLLPFSFTDTTTTKRHPAVVLSSAKNFNNPTGHSLMAMITASENVPWVLDTFIKDLSKAGLNISSVVRLKPLPLTTILNFLFDTEKYPQCLHQRPLKSERLNPAKVSICFSLKLQWFASRHQPRQPVAPGSFHPH